jgi:hypothetical protein
MLYCLRGDRSKKAFTLISSLKKALVKLDSETLAQLRKREYQTGVDVSFGNRDKTLYVKELIPVLYGEDDDMMITYDLDLMVGISREAREALDVLKNVLLSVREGILLEPGDLLIFDNRRVVHGRAAYDAFFDGQDRWLQRSYISRDVDFATQVTSTGRVVRTEF